MTGTHIEPATLEFLRRLKNRNHREWFCAHKDEYHDALDNFTDFVDRLISAFGETETSIATSEADDCIFRIHRDLRFSTDRTPYKTGFTAHLVENGKRGNRTCAGYYLRVEPGNCRIACGAYRPAPAWLARLRQTIAADPDRFEAIIKAPAFSRAFGDLQGEQLKTVPRGFSRSHPAADWLRFKGFLAVREIQDSALTADESVNTLCGFLKIGIPLVDFLNCSPGQATQGCAPDSGEN